MRTPGEFAAALFGECLPEGTFVQTWALRDKRSKWWRAAQSLDVLAGHEDTFIGVALAAIDYGPRRRMPANEAVGVAGLWLDLDVIGGPENREHGAPSKATALAVGSAVLEPTLVVDSGHGIHTWHLLPEAWRFRSRLEQTEAGELTAKWYALHAQAAQQAGWHLDQSTRDLARIMRLPGTVNAKGERSVPVVVVRSDGPRYGLDVLRATTSNVKGGEALARAHGTVATVGELCLKRGAAPPADRLRALLENSPEFANTWYRQRPEFVDDQSRYDLALADVAAQAGWSDQDIATLIGAHRGWDEKAFRRDYVARTIGLARTMAEEAA